MSVTKKDVLAVLEPDEPNYAAAAALGTESLPILQDLVAGDDPMLASKAAYAASMLSGDQGLSVVLAAAHSDETIVRVAAASAARNLPSSAAGDVLKDLFDDADQGVRKVARSSLPPDASDTLRQLARPERSPAQAEGAGGQASAAPDALLGVVMPGEAPAGAAGAGRMPGEAASPGLMPGETARRAGDGGGLMPGEAG
jgi:HEAT repeat protein